MNFDVVISGDTRLVARFAEWPAELHGSLYARIAEMTAMMEDRVRSLAPVKSGRLRSQIVSRVYDDQTKIRGVVTLGGGLPSNDYGKAAALEYGAPGRGGRFKVKSYRRTISKAFGHAIAPVTVQVKAYSRLARLDPRMYLHGGLQSVAPAAKAELQAIIDQKAREF